MSPYSACAASPVIAIAFQVALEIVNPALALVGAPYIYPQPGGVPAQSMLYTFAVYNLAGSNLINYAQDTPPSTYFTDLRATLKIGNFVPGVISSSSDEGTSQSLLNPEVMKNLLFADLVYLKDPYGRQYLAIAARFGSLWGFT